MGAQGAPLPALHNDVEKREAMKEAGVSVRAPVQ